MRYCAKTLDDIVDFSMACDDDVAGVPYQAVGQHCEIVTDFHRLEQLWQQWERLWESDPRAEIFQTPEWIRSWWRAFGADCELCTVVVFQDDQIEGVLPLVRRGKRLQFLGIPQADYADILCLEHRTVEVLSAAFRALEESVRGWDECSLEHLSRNSRIIRHSSDLPKDVRANLRCVPADRQQTIILRDQREAVFKSLLGKHHTRRLQNKLRKMGELRFQHLESAREILPHLPEFFRHLIRRNAVLGRQSVCARSDFFQFIESLIRELAPLGRVRFGILELNGKPLAWDLGFQVNGKYLLYQHTFDLDAWHYTPGEVLLWNELRYARDHVSREFDYGRGDELYKDRFSNYSRETFSAFLEPAGVRGTVRAWARTSQACLQPGLGKIKEVGKRRWSLRAFRSVRMWMLGAAGCLRQARQNGTLTRCTLKLAKELFGATILSKKSTDVFMLDAARTGWPAPDASAHPDLQITEARFGEMVDLAWEHPDILSLKDLAYCRKRVKNGDRAYIVREQSEITVVCWASSAGSHAEEPEVQRFDVGQGCPAVVTDICWSHRHYPLGTSYRQLLAFLVRQAENQNAALLVHCGRKQGALRKELELQNFQRKFQSTRYQIFSHFRRDVVSPCLENNFHSSELA